MKALKNFESSYRELLSEMTALANDNARLALALDAEKTVSRGLAATLRNKKRDSDKHKEQLQVVRARASAYKLKMGEYQRDLAALRTVVRHQPRT